VLKTQYVNQTSKNIVQHSVQRENVSECLTFPTASALIQPVQDPRYPAPIAAETRGTFLIVGTTFS
jgi:hypothetical protein